MRLVRWGNLLFLGALVWVMEKWVAVPILNAAAYGEQMPWYILLLLEIAVILIAAGGYVINDYFDVKIDRINRPDAVIVTRTISKPAAMRLSICLSAAGAACGILEAILLRSMTIGILFVIVPGLLWFYSSSYKRLFMIGNLCSDTTTTFRDYPTLYLAPARPLCMVRRICALCLPADLDSRDHQRHAGSDGRPGIGMPLNASCLGRFMDQSVRYCSHHTDVSYHRTYLVSPASFPYRLDQPQHALYRLRCCRSAAECDLVAMVGEDSQRLQELSASD